MTEKQIILGTIQAQIAQLKNQYKAGKITIRELQLATKPLRLLAEVTAETLQK